MCHLVLSYHVCQRLWTLWNEILLWEGSTLTAFRTGWFIWHLGTKFTAKSNKTWVNNNLQFSKFFYQETEKIEKRAKWCWLNLKILILKWSTKISETKINVRKSTFCIIYFLSNFRPYSHETFWRTILQ